MLSTERSAAGLLLVAIATCVATMAIRVGAQSQPAANDLMDLDRRLQEAAVKGDAQLFERYLADDFVFTHSGGQTDTKADWVARAKQVPAPYLARRVSDQTVETHGDVALVAGRLDVRVPPSPKQAQAAPQCYALRYLHVYGKRNGHWMFLSHRTTQMLEESHPCPQ